MSDGLLLHDLSRMKPSMTDALCTRCGLCCDGSLFADVEVRRAEATGLEILGLEVEDNDQDGLQLLQPCGALRGKRCGIYAHRPRTCRAFECRLLQDAQRGDVSVDRALEHITEAHRRIRRVRELLARFEPGDARLPLKERCAEALAGQVGTSPEAKRQSDELDAAMSAVETLIRETFLDDAVSAAAPGEAVPE